MTLEEIFLRDELNKDKLRRGRYYIYKISPSYINRYGSTNRETDISLGNILFFELEERRSWKPVTQIEKIFLPDSENIHRDETDTYVLVVKPLIGKVKVYKLEEVEEDPLFIIEGRGYIKGEKVKKQVDFNFEYVRNLIENNIKTEFNVEGTLAYFYMKEVLVPFGDPEVNSKVEPKKVDCHFGYVFDEEFPNTLFFFSWIPQKITWEYPGLGKFSLEKPSLAFPIEISKNKIEKAQWGGVVTPNNHIWWKERKEYVPHPIVYQAGGIGKWYQTCIPSSPLNREAGAIVRDLRNGKISAIFIFELLKSCMLTFISPSGNFLREYARTDGNEPPAVNYLDD